MEEKLIFWEKSVCPSSLRPVLLIDCLQRNLHQAAQSQVDWSRVNRMGRWYKPWFYHHVRTFLQKGDQVVLLFILVNIKIRFVAKITLPSPSPSALPHFLLTPGWVHPNIGFPPETQQTLLLADTPAFAMGSSPFSKVSTRYQHQHCCLIMGHVRLYLVVLMYQTDMFWSIPYSY